MRKTVAGCVVAMGAGLALMMGQGCRKQAAPVPVQGVVPSVAQVQPDFHFGSLPVEDVDAGVTPRIDRSLRQWRQVQPAPVVRVTLQPVQEQSTDAQAAAAGQREQDERLLEQQEAESQSQQEELDRDIEENVRMQQEVQAEPRIQDTPGATPLQPE
jgi:hypothetical protein